MGITLVGEIDAPDINAWFAHMRTSPGGHGKPRAERTIQTYARSARAFFHWLVRREIIETNPFDRVTFPKVGKPLVQTIDADEFARLLLACAPPNETGPIDERAEVCNRAILWVLYDTGIRVSELCGLHVGDFDRRHGILTVTGKGSKERRIALGNNCLRNLLYYLDKYRPDEMVLTQRSGGSKLERVDSPQKGKGSCKRSNELLRENVSKKRSNWCDRATNHRRKLHAIWESQTVRCTIGASNFPNTASRHFPAADIKLHKKRKCVIYSEKMHCCDRSETS
jgi:integrase